MDRFVVLSGCSGGGKSTLLTELARRGFTTVEEPGRRIVADQTSTGGSALPWLDLAAFARRAIELALNDRANADRSGWTFFDRVLVEASAAIQHVSCEPVLEYLGRLHRYNRHVFLTPPWPEIYKTDTARRHKFQEATGEYQRLLAAYELLDYETILLPKVTVSERADFLLTALGL